jgi:hypothetical protein
MRDDAKKPGFFEKPGFWLYLHTPSDSSWNRASGGSSSLYILRLMPQRAGTVAALATFDLLIADSASLVAMPAINNANATVTAKRIHPTGRAFLSTGE